MHANVAICTKVTLLEKVKILDKMTQCNSESSKTH